LQGNRAQPLTTAAAAGCCTYFVPLDHQQQYKTVSTSCRRIDHLLLAGSYQLLQIVNNSPNEEMIEKNWPGAAAATTTTTIRKQQEAAAEDAKIQNHQGRHLNDFAKSNSK
jgi:hypothetical protein